MKSADKESTSKIYLDPAAEPETRIKDLLKQMTLEEKIACLGTHPDVPRLGIQGAGHMEGLHGVAFGEPGGWGKPEPIPTTQFPQAIGLAQCWDPELMRRCGEAEAVEARFLFESSKRQRAGLVMRCPNADLGRDPRWGRTEEVYGEDPFLNGTLAVAMVRGLQGDHPRYWRTASLLKHFLANSNEKNRGSSSSDFDERLFHEYYAMPFRMAIQEGGANAYMAAYNAYNGVPAAVHPMLREITMKQWGLDGIICTDGGAYKMLVTEHQYYADLPQAGAQCLRSGINQFLDEYQEGVSQAVQEGLIDEALIDERLTGVFRVMIKLGMWDPPEMVPYTQVGEAKPWESDAHKALAYEAAVKSLVLLKNENAFLPLTAEGLAKIAVIGKRGSDVVKDWYGGDPPYDVPVSEGLRSRLGDSAKVMVDDGSDIERAVKTAAEADVVLLCVGNHPQGDDGWAKVKSPTDGKEAVDRQDMNLEQEALVRAVHRANASTVMVLFASFPTTIVWAQRHLPAILMTTHCGQELGNAVADALFGAANPGGRLVQTWQTDQKQLPPMMDYNIRNGRTYLYDQHQPLYAFGHGLSYTRFEYEGMHVGGGALGLDGETAVTVDLFNAGDRDGDEVVQLYVSRPRCPVPQPALALKAFKRVHLKAGEHLQVKLTIRGRDLAWWDAAAATWRLEKGQIVLRVGASSRDLRLEATALLGGTVEGGQVS